MIVAQSDDAPLIQWSWISDRTDVVLAKLLEHIQLTVIAVVVGLIISFPLALWAYRNKKVVYPPITVFTGLLYTIPSLALFALLIPYTGLSVLTAEIGLVSYTLLILIRNIVAGLDGVPADTKEAALGMGFTRRQLLWRVELPLALPVILAGIRVATVTTIGLVTVAAFIGKGGLGYFILLGFDRLFPTALLLGSVLSMAFAIGVDGLLVWTERLVTPWSRSREVVTA
ncbi:MAG: ABC transporter permease [Actinomycetota bacterium]